MRFFRRVGVPAVAFLLIAGVTPAHAATPRKGQLCAAADVGKTAKDTSGTSLTCAVDSGGKNRWGVGASAIATVASTKANTTKATTSKATTATTKSSTATTKTKTTKASGSAAIGVLVKGRFCKVADDGLTGADKNGVRLVCKVDAGGKHRWQAA